MNVAELLFPTMETARAATTLAVNILIQSTLIIAVGLLAVRWLRNHGAAVQSTVLRVTLIAVMACPAASWALARAGVSGFGIELPEAEPIASVSEPPMGARLPGTAAALAGNTQTALLVDEGRDVDSQSDSSRVPALPREHGDAVRHADIVDGPATASANTQSGAGLSAVTASVPRELPRAGKAFVFSVGWAYAAVGTTWLLVALLLLARIVVANLVIFRGRVGAADADASTVKLCQSLAAAMGIRAPAIRIGSRIQSPCLVGVFRPAILLPATMTSVSRDVLVHELAHVFRRDCWWQMLSCGLRAVFWFQPLAWSLSRRIGHAADEVADDFVVQFGSDRSDYARQLVDIAERYQADRSAAYVGAGIAAFKSSLAKRVLRILDTSRSLSTRTGLLALLSISGLGATCTLMVGLLGTGAIENGAPDELQDKPQEQQAADVASCRGLVLDSQGRPVAGAKLYLAYYSKPPVPATVRATSDADGRFAFEFEREILGDNYADARVVAVASGFGLDWQPLSAEASQTRDVQLRLVPDVPVEGRIIDIEGHPVAGGTVEVQAVLTTPDDNLDRLLQAWERDQEPAFRYAAREELLTKQLEWMSAVDLPAAKTDADGRFRLTGYGKDRWLRIVVDGPGVGGSHLVALTRPASEVAALAKVGSTLSPTYGSRFEHAVPPGRTILGTITEKGTGKPIAGAYVYCQSRAVTTDSEGRYRLDGVGKDEKYWVAAKTDSHFAGGLSAADTAGLDPITVDLELEKGIALQIRLKDKSTGRPIRGAFGYYAAIENKHVEGTTFASRPYVGTLGGTNPDGSGTMVVYPGPGYLGVRADENRFAPDYPEETRSDLRIKAIPNTFEAGLFHTVVPIDPQHGKPETLELELELDPGGTRIGRVTGPDGQPLENVIYAGKTAIRPWAGIGYQTLSSPDFEVLGLLPDHERTLLFMQRDQGLAKAIEVTPGAEPLVVALEPTGALTGQVVDADGNPRTGVSVRLQVRGHTAMQGFGLARPKVDSLVHTFGIDMQLRDQVLLPTAEVDAAGKFRIEGLIAGFTYDVYTFINRDFGQLASGVQCVPGITHDIGALQVQPIQRGQPKVPQPKVDEAKVITRPAQPDQSVRYSGRVLDPDGKPLAGAKLYLVGSLVDEWKAGPHGTSDEQGTFEIAVAKSKFVKQYDNEPWKWASVVAVADGWGPGVQNFFDSQPGQPFELRLTKAGLPVAGRIVDLQGQPISGVRVAFSALKVPRADRGGVDDWHAALQSRREGMQIEREFFSMVGLPEFLENQQTQTDENGRFWLPPVGTGRIVSLIIDGPTIESQEINIVTRENMPSISAPWYAEAPALGTLHYHATGSDHVAGPTRPVEGIVRDRKTGRPLVGFQVAGPAVGNPLRPVQTTTDQNGRFRLTGLAVGKAQKITVLPGDDQPYVKVMHQIDLRAGEEPLQVDLQVPRGVWAEGRVVDKQTGQPALARISYYAFVTNDAYSGLGDLDLADQELSIHTDQDGAFRVAVLPGRGILAARASSDHYLFGSGADQIDGPKDDWSFRTGPLLCAYSNFHTLVEVNPDIDDTEVIVELLLDTGLTATGQILDPDGRPLAGTHIRGLYAMSYWRQNSSSDFEVSGIAAGKTRQLLFWHEEQNLAGSLVIAPGSQAVLVQLEPAGTLTGRLLDEDGAPWPDARLRSAGGRVDLASDVEQQFVGHPQPLDIRTDSQGHFRITGLVPGLKYGFAVNQDFRSVVFVSDVSVESGQTKDLGDLKAAPR